MANTGIAPGPRSSFCRWWANKLTPCCSFRMGSDCLLSSDLAVGLFKITIWVLPSDLFPRSGQTGSIMLLCGCTVLSCLNLLNVHNCMHYFLVSLWLQITIFLKLLKLIIWETWTLKLITVFCNPVWKFILVDPAYFPPLPPSQGYQWKDMLFSTFESCCGFWPQCCRKETEITGHSSTSWCCWVCQAPPHPPQKNPLSASGQMQRSRGIALPAACFWCRQMFLISAC